MAGAASRHPDLSQIGLAPLLTIQGRVQVTPSSEHQLGRAASYSFTITMRSYDGCWTCRMRKKRCDEVRPLCDNCSTLQITCHFGNEKPPWMDGGANQRMKAEEVKREVKRAAARRRGILPTEIVESLDVETMQDIELAGNESHEQSSSTGRSPSSSEAGSNSSPSWTSVNTSHIVGPASSNTVRDVGNEQGVLSVDYSPIQEPRSSELDRRFIAFYFDYFFPFLFPFYKPTLLEGGRSWIMELVTGNQAMWHTTLCLSTYFVSVALDGAATGHNVCKTMAWDKLLQQMSVTFMMLQRNLDNVTSGDFRDFTIQKSRTMGSIIQLQRFEIAVGNFENCQRHLEAAIALFRQMFHAGENAATNSSGVCILNSILNRMGQPLWDTRSQETRAWSSDQAAFRFYSALLLVDDVVASTCMDGPPSLSAYHSQLLTNDGNPNGRAPLSLEDFIGCENWVIVQIGEISALDAWKNLMKRSGQLDMMEMVARASAIKQTLLCNLARLDAVANTPKTSNLGLFTAYNDHSPIMPGGCTAFVTRVWAHAALLYLSIVVSGWQPGSVGIRENVVRILALLEQMPKSELLRAMVWPFCIAGCLAEHEEECRFRALTDALVPHRLFGAARKALEIMENTWKCREELDIDMDLATCVCSLGYMSLLV
jgi:hypothetical protein